MSKPNNTVTQDKKREPEVSKYAAEWMREKFGADGLVLMTLSRKVAEFTENGNLTDEESAMLDTMIKNAFQILSDDDDVVVVDGLEYVDVDEDDPFIDGVDADPAPTFPSFTEDDADDANDEPIVIEVADVPKSLAREWQTSDPVAQDTSASSIFSEDPLTDFTGKEFALFGRFDTGSQDEISALLQTLGATSRVGVSINTDYLVVGKGQADEPNLDTMCSTVKDALEFQKAGHKLKIINEDFFIEATGQ